MSLSLPSSIWILTVQRQLEHKVTAAGREVVSPADVSVVTVMVHRQIPDLPLGDHCIMGVKGKGSKVREGTDPKPHFWARGRTIKSDTRWHLDEGNAIKMDTHSIAYPWIENSLNCSPKKNAIHEASC